MLKKMIIGIMILFLFTVTACSSDEEASKEKKDDGSVEKTEQKKEGIEVDKGLLNVEITLPEMLFEEDNMDDVVERAKEDGAKEVKKNDDGSVTFKMSKKDHKKMMEEMKEDVAESLDEIKKDDAFTSIKDITYNKDFSDITLVVDKETYENSFDGFAIFGIGLTSTFYHVFDGENPEKIKIQLNIEDEASGEVFEEVILPEDLENMGETEDTKEADDIEE